MRQGQNSKRSRGRSGGRRNSSPRHQSFDSNGPSIRIRGNAHQVYEKYLQLARDANVAGDRVSAENMYQHAEHYFRILNVDDGDSQQRSQNRGNGSDQRQQHRNARQGQDGSPAGIDTDLRAEQPAQSDSSDGPNGSGEKSGNSRGNGAGEQLPAGAEASNDSDVVRPERQPRRNGGRPRNSAPTPDTAEASPPEPDVVADPEPVAEAPEADTKEVQ